MHLRRVLAASTVAVLPVLLIACNDDSSSAKSKATTTTKTGATIPGAAGVTSTTAAPKPFGQGVAAVSTGIDGAGGDVCKLATQLNDIDGISNPSTPAEAKQAMGLLAKLFGAIADAAPADLSKEANTIKATMAKADQQAAAAGYDPKVFTSSDGLSALQDPGFAQAMSTFMDSVSKKCGIDLLGSGSSSSSKGATTSTVKP